MIYLEDVSRLYNVYVCGWLFGDDTISLADVEKAYQRIDAHLFRLNTTHAEQAQQWLDKLDQAYKMIVQRAGVNA